MSGIVELKLNGHTNICGTNASGKTTLQRLVPVFYGEYPSRVVPSTRDSFERWYLPHDSSFIIYEYIKSDGLAYQAVLASAGDGKGVNYQPTEFVKHSPSLALDEGSLKLNYGSYIYSQLDGFDYHHPRDVKTIPQAVFM